MSVSMLSVLLQPEEGKEESNMIRESFRNFVWILLYILLGDDPRHYTYSYFSFQVISDDFCFYFQVINDDFCMLGRAGEIIRKFYFDLLSV